MSRFLSPTCIVLMAMCLACCSKSHAEEPCEADPLQELQGSWLREVRTKQGVFKLVKVHEGNTSEVTTYDPAGNIVRQHVSDFSLDNSGKVDTFTFYNSQVVKGEGAGKLTKEPQTYVYQIKEDRFYEVYGLLHSDTQPLRVIVWQREQPAEEEPAEPPGTAHRVECQ